MSETSKWQLFLIIILVCIAGYIAYPSKEKPLFKQGEWMEGVGIQLGLDLQGGSEIRVALKKEAGKEADISDFTDKAKDIIERRINLSGLKEPRIQKYGNDQILIQLPGMDAAEAERVKKIITTSGKLEFKLEADKKIVEDYNDKFPKAPPGYLWYETETQGENRERNERVLVEEKARLGGEDITKAGVRFEGFQGVVIDFELNAHGAALLNRFSTDYSEETLGEQEARRLAIILDNKLVSAPRLKSRIPNGKGVITGDFTLQRGQDLATVLRSGSLPASLEIVSESFVGPSLGEDAIKRGAISFILAILAVILFMLIYYHLSGLIAIIAMGMNFILLVGILAMLSATLTLPGIAALVLTLGMAVDANIIFYERIREEVNKGKDTFAAFETGFNRAFVTVLDANLTTLLAGIVLYYFGSGTLKGFAVVLCIGIITTLFTGYFASKVMLRAAIEGDILKKFSMLRLFEKANVRWMQYAGSFKIMSIILVLLSVILFAVKGGDYQGIDFTGGTVVNINFDKQISIGEVRDAIVKIEAVDPATNRKITKYPDAEVQSVMKHVEGGMQTSFKGVLDQTQFSSSEFQIRTKYVKSQNEVLEFKKDLQTVFADKIAPDQLISSTLISKVRDYRYRITIVLPASKDIKEVQDKLKSRCTAEGKSEPFIASAEEETQPVSPTIVAQNKTYYVYFKEDNDVLFEKIVREELGFSNGPFSKVENISNVVSKELKQNAIIAIFLSWIGMIIYLAVRFEFKYGLAAVIALVHDVIISAGCVVLFNIIIPKSWGMNVEINLSTVAALLTIIGYSVNDTIVVFDRLRENFKLMKGETRFKIINRSINETLGRTIWTSTTVFLTVIILFLITAKSGGAVPSFAFPMLIGTVFGTYSSVYIASAWLLTKKDNEEMKQEKQIAQEPAKA